MKYFVLPNNVYIVRNPRVASMAMAVGIMQTFYPMFCGNCGSPPEYYTICPVTDTPNANAQIFMLVRDPVDRFLSTCVLMDVTIPQVFQAVKNNQLDIHFESQAANATGATLFKYDSQIPQFCAAVGLPVPPVINESGIKPTPTANQLTQIQNYLAADIALYNSIA